MATPPSIEPHKLRNLFVPLLVSIILGVAIYYGGEAYQGIGLEGLGTIRIILGYLLGISEFLILATLLQRLVQYVVLDWLIASTLGSPAPRLLSQLSAFIIYLLAITAIIGIVFHKDLTVVLAASGAAGIVIGMALQGLILDVFSGLAINLDRAIRIGDNIRMHGSGDSVIEGKVEEISWRTTRLLDRFCNVVILPNRVVAGATVTNFSLPQPFLETSVTVTIDVEVPTNRAIRVLQAAAVEVSGQFAPVEAPSPSVTVKEITPEGVQYTVFIYPSFETRPRGRNLVQQAILRHLSCAGLRPARPKQERLKGERNPPVSNQPDAIQLAKLIGATVLFQDLEEADRRLLATLAPLRYLQAGIFVVHAGEVATSMFLVIEGLLSGETTRRGPGGKPLAAQNLGPGSLIGGEVMLLGDAYELTVRTRTTVLLCEIDYDLLGKLLAHQPQAAHQLSRRVAAQLTNKLAKEDTGNQQWQMSEADLAAEVLSNLKRSFLHLKLN